MKLSNDQVAALARQIRREAHQSQEDAYEKLKNSEEVRAHVTAVLSKTIDFPDWFNQAAFRNLTPLLQVDDYIDDYAKSLFTERSIKTQEELRDEIVLAAITHDTLPELVASISVFSA